MKELINLFDKKAIILDLKATTKDEALQEIADHLKNNNFISDQKSYYQALVKREKEFSTGIGNNVALPHAQSDVVLQDVILIARPKNGLAWEASDQKPVNIIFSIALNAKNAKTQTTILAQLAKLMMNQKIMTKLQSLKTKEAIIKTIAAFDFSEKSLSKQTSEKNIVAITACPTGIAHTFLAAQALETSGKKLNFNIKVETQGRQIDNKLSQQDIDQADAIILAIDKGIDGMERFNGKKVLKVSTKKTINNADAIIKDALAGQGEVIKVASSEGQISSGDLSWGSFKNVYHNLMGGVSRMLPFVIAGGILIGLAFLLDSGITGNGLGSTREISRWFKGLGDTIFGIFVPVLGAYVAYSIIGAEGLLPGFTAGLIASGGGALYGSGSNAWGSLTPGIDQDVLKAGSGFIGAMVGGYLAAAAIMILRKYIFHKTNQNFQGVVSIIAIPVMSVLVTGAVMFGLQIPLAYLAYGLKLGLMKLQELSLLPLLGIILGIMMASDMGGPINKSAYVFAAGSLEHGGEAEYQVMAIVMIAGMVPPLVIAFSTLVFRDKAWSKKEQEAGYASWLMGAFFISEGAIPYAATDPKRVIPSIILGSAIAGGIMGALQVGVTAPHGGIFVFALLRSYLFTSQGLQIGMGVVFALLALAAGTVAGGFTLGFWRKKAIKENKLVLI